MTDFSPLSELLPDIYQRILLPEPSVHLSAFPKLSHSLKGLRSREYTIFCGPTGTGKTAFLAHLALEVAKQGHGVYVASVETGRLDFGTRMLSAEIGQNWNIGEPVDLEKVKAFEYDHPHFNKLPVYMARYEDRVDITTLLDGIRFAIEVYKVKLAILDNLNFFMEVTTSANAIIEMDRVVHEAIIFCKKNDVHMIMVMHPKKTDHGRVESEFDIKGSSTAVQEAHNVLLWNRPLQKPDDPIFSPYRELKIAKCRRYGMNVGKSISFRGVDGVRFIEEVNYDSAI